MDSTIKRGMERHLESHETPSTSAGNYWAAFVPQRSIMEQAGGDGMLLDSDTELKADLERVVGDYQKTIGCLLADMAVHEANDKKLKFKYNRAKAQLDKFVAKSALESKYTLNTELISVKNEKDTERKRFEEMQIRVASFTVSLEQLEGTISSQNQTIADLTQKLHVSEAEKNRLRLEVRSKSGLCELNNKYFNENLATLLRDQGIEITGDDFTTNTSLIALLAEELGNKNKMIEGLEQGISPAASQEITRLKAENSRMKVELAEMDKIYAQYNELVQKIGTMEAKARLATQLELDHSNNLSQMGLLKVQLKEKDDLILKQGSTLEFYNSEMDSAVTSQDKTSEIANLTRLLKKYKDDYNFIYDEYTVLKSAMAIQKQEFSTSLLRNKSFDNIQLDKRRSTDHHDHGSRMIEESLTAGQDADIISRDWCSIAAGIFGWRLTVDGQHVRCIYADDADMHIQVKDNNELVLSDKLETMILDDTPDMLTLKDDISVLMANITLLIKNE